MTDEWIEKRATEEIGHDVSAGASLPAEDAVGAARASGWQDIFGDLLDFVTTMHGRMACTCRLEPFVGGPIPCQTCELGNLIGMVRDRLPLPPPRGE